MKRYKKLNFATVIQDITSRYANGNALGFVEEDQLTYLQMGKIIEAVKAFSEELGIQPGDKVAIYSQNMPNWGITYLALLSMGAIVVPILPDFCSSELQNVLQHSESKAIFISNNLIPKLEQVKQTQIESTVCLDDFSVIQSNRTFARFRKNAIPTKQYNPDEKELAILIYTSGTTGNSKGVMLSQYNVLFNALQTNHVQNITKEDRFLSILPLSHTYENTIGLILPLLQGASVTYLRKPPTPSVLIPAMQTVKPTFMLTVPMIIEKIYRNKILPELEKNVITNFLLKKSPTRKLLYRLAGKKLYKTFGGHLRFYGIGGAKLDATVEQFLIDAKFPYGVGYGLTETSPLLAATSMSTTRFQSTGPGIPNCQLKINNPDPVTGEGEIWAKGPNVMLGYYKNEKETNAVLTDDGWFKTGDLGVFDKDGWLSHKGRLKNLILGANGENIYPEEIESLINNYKHVVESIVVKKKGKLVAMVHFNREELEQKIQEMKADFTHMMDEKIEEITQMVDDTIDELAQELHDYINARVNKFSRIQLLVVHPDPFQKTATQKIKRYLYH